MHRITYRNVIRTVNMFQLVPIKAKTTEYVNDDIEIFYENNIQSSINRYGEKNYKLRYISCQLITYNSTVLISKKT